jgi:hypothetical protein
LVGKKDGYKQPDVTLPEGAKQLKKFHKKNANGMEELEVGTYKFLNSDDKKVVGDMLTPHHMPSSAYIRAKLLKQDISKKEFKSPLPEGICIIMYHAPLADGGRHERTRSYGKQPFLDETTVQALQRDVINVRLIYAEDGLFAGANKTKVNNALAKHIMESQKTEYGKGKFDGVK